MISKPDKNKIRQRRHMRVRGKISGTAERPRLSVYRSNKNIYAQLIDDVKGVTLASASTMDSEVSGKTKTEQASGVGELIAKRAAAAFLGGAVAMFGARMADGCPSGHGLSGMMQLSVSAFIALMLFFGTGVLVAHFVYRRGSHE